MSEKDERDCTGTSQFQNGSVHFCLTVVEQMLLRKQKVLKISWPKFPVQEKGLWNTDFFFYIVSYKLCSLKVRL